MFMVFNKEKISSYLVLLSTVIILFGFAIVFNKDDTIQTSTNIQNTSVINNINQENLKMINYEIED